MHYAVKRENATDVINTTDYSIIIIETFQSLGRNAQSTIRRHVLAMQVDGGQKTCNLGVTSFKQQHQARSSNADDLNLRLGTRETSLHSPAFQTFGDQDLTFSSLFWVVKTLPQQVLLRAAKSDSGGCICEA